MTFKIPLLFVLPSGDCDSANPFTCSNLYAFYFFYGYALTSATISPVFDLLLLVIFELLAYSFSLGVNRGVAAVFLTSGILVSLWTQYRLGKFNYHMPVSHWHHYGWNSLKKIILFIISFAGVDLKVWSTNFPYGIVLTLMFFSAAVVILWLLALYRSHGKKFFTEDSFHSVCLAYQTLLVLEVILFVSLLLFSPFRGLAYLTGVAAFLLYLELYIRKLRPYTLAVVAEVYKTLDGITVSRTSTLKQE